MGVFAHPHDGAFAISLFDGLDCVLERGIMKCSAFILFSKTLSCAGLFSINVSCSHLEALVVYMKANNLNKNIRIPHVTISLIALICSFTGCTRSTVPLRTEQVLGTVCTINAYDDGTKTLYDELFSRLHEIEDEFSVNKATSEVSKVHDAAGVDPD